MEDARKGIGYVLAVKYRPQPLPAWVGPVLTGILAFGAVSRGSDLLISPAPTGAVVDIVKLLGVTFWGTAVLTAGVLLYMSLIFRRLALSVIAHIFACAVYLGYSVATFQGVFGAGQGWRHATALLVPALIYGVWTWTFLGSLREAGAEVYDDGHHADPPTSRRAGNLGGSHRHASLEGQPGVPEGTRQRPHRV